MMKKLRLLLCVIFSNIPTTDSNLSSEITMSCTTSVSFPFRTRSDRGPSQPQAQKTHPGH